ncbi:putative hydrolase or acyltransferase of alpha/beta superfamily [Thioflavicoccus mobilis 8321]|uniref:Putative hydrolase or acyltransferase of alpha/beta superfamily n=1 Tax=Thioflavicoccus mobilis 8321 TaxID=765912 RepID=L0GTE7_9GAMM|nr:alpha/beta hydrolase [Thioflavicoccus mobilis]AGA89281.1 putative hydrolase or acyltransferase of alpha/beta superfamily [Thioflavicoccus mobilis 8321]
MTRAKRRSSRSKKGNHNAAHSTHPKGAATPKRAKGAGTPASPAPATKAPSHTNKGGTKQATANPKPAAKKVTNSGGAVPLPDAVAAPRHDHVTQDGVRINYYVDGPEGGRPLVLIHAVNAAPSTYELKPLFEHYCATRRVYALDLPGFGFSDRGDRRYSPQLYSGVIADFVRRAVGEPVDAIALSLGCEFTSGAALREPDLFATLALISPTGFSERNLPNGQGQLAKWLHKALSVPLWGSRLFSLLTVRPSIRYFMSKSFVGKVPDAYIEYAYATAHQPGAHHAPLYFLSGQLFTTAAYGELYSKLTQPVLVIRDRDPYVGFERLAELMADHPNWTEEQIAPSCGLPHWERLAETAKVLDRFWAANSAQPEPEPEPEPGPAPAAAPSVAPTPADPEQAP